MQTASELPPPPPVPIGAIPGAWQTVDIKDVVQARPRAAAPLSHRASLITPVHLSHRASLITHHSRPSLPSCITHHSSLPSISPIVHHSSLIPPVHLSATFRHSPPPHPQEHAKRAGTPPDAIMLGLLAKLQKHSAPIKIAFRFYALAGASGSTDEDPDSINMNQCARVSRTQP
eukprot:6206640-Prymnesium_polylepis.2